MYLGTWVRQKEQEEEDPARAWQSSKLRAIRGLVSEVVNEQKA